MRRGILVGDTVVVRDGKCNLYRNAYGHAALSPRVVVQEDRGTKRRRLHLDGPPGLLWIGDARRVKKGDNGNGT